MTHPKKEINLSPVTVSILFKARLSARQEVEQLQRSIVHSLLLLLMLSFNPIPFQAVTIQSHNKIALRRCLSLSPPPSSWTHRQVTTPGLWSIGDSDCGGCFEYKTTRKWWTGKNVGNQIEMRNMPILPMRNVYVLVYYNVGLSLSGRHSSGGCGMLIILWWNAGHCVSVGMSDMSASSQFVTVL